MNGRAAAMGFLVALVGTTLVGVVAQFGLIFVAPIVGLFGARVTSGGSVRSGSSLG